ncbi:hypothetical protein [Pukyongiella litopenaei]|uniref:Uncharacterized protein n=1 Tax=Pukyongiella litopenaei TaxID=2605946 RepID=A0A2S0MMA1_9RHOB|nr:hypothetical protein [Pukyongiella litopenaei]AVO37010.2 hypothetical protein C6Y53_04365 [Pukyongiella litopenaei]
MFEALLVTTSSEGLQPLGSAAQRSFELLTGTLRARLGEDCARLLAEPVAAEHGEQIDWHAPMPGRAVAFPDLDAGDQARLKAALAPRIAAIRAEAETLAASDAPEDQRLAEALGNAIEIPGEEMIYAVRGDDGAVHPVLVHWAWVRQERQAVRGVLTAMIPRPAAAGAGATLAAAAPVAAPGLAAWAGWWWLILLGWLLLAALLAAILWLLVAPCGLDRSGPYFCPADPPEIHAALSESRVLADRVAGLEHELALRNRICKPVIPLRGAEAAPPVAPSAPTAPAPAPVPAPADKAEAPAGLDDRLRERGAARGALNFTLVWHTRDDIDLRVECPTGQEVSYLKRDVCGGRYDLDANLRADTAIEDPVENVVFDAARPGLYKVRAHLRGERTDGDKAVTLHVLYGDGRAEQYSGTVNARQRSWVTNISISG